MKTKIQQQQNYRHISLMKTDTKTLKKSLAIWIQQCFRRITHHNQMVFISQMQEVFNSCKSISVIQHINKLKNKNRLIISADAEKALYKIRYPLMVKTLQKVGTQGTYFNILKATYSKSTVYIILIRKNTKVFLRSGTT